MPETNKREYAGKGTGSSVKMGGRMSPGSAPKFPDKPSCRDGKYEGTAAAKTKLAKF